MKPILFNTEMVRAILDGRKTVTRRVVKPQPPATSVVSMNGPYAAWRFWEDDPQGHLIKPPYRQGDILYVRETFCGWYLPGLGMKYCYKASDPNGNRAPTGPDPDGEWNIRPWRPSIHMPKEAARIFLRVSDVRVERLWDITAAECVHEGIPKESLVEVGEEFTVGQFHDLWNTTIKSADLPLYGWDANPWVWVIEFEKIEKEAAV